MTQSDARDRASLCVMLFIYFYFFMSCDTVASKLGIADVVWCLGSRLVFCSCGNNLNDKCYNQWDSL